MIQEPNLFIISKQKLDLLVVPPANACSEPNAMMVELHDTVVADIAVGRSDWPEYVAGLTELKLKQHRRVC